MPLEVRIVSLQNQLQLCGNNKFVLIMGVPFKVNIIQKFTKTRKIKNDQNQTNVEKTSEMLALFKGPGERGQRPALPEMGNFPFFHQT